MKKLFKYEINESIAAKAAMNCVHKRLFKEHYMGSPTPQEQEEDVYSDVLNKIINDGLDYWDVWEMAKQGKATKIELEISGVLLDLFETLMYNGYGEILSKVASGEIDKRELKRIIVDVLMEQDVDTFPRGESEYNSWVNEHNSEIVKRLEAKFNEEQEEDGINKGGMHNLVQDGHIMNTHSMNNELEPDFSDLEEQEAYNMNFRAIAELVADQIDRENPEAKGVYNNMDTIFAIVKEVWRNNYDDLYIYDFDEVQQDDCYKFFDKHYEEIKNEYLKREHNSIMDATHDDLFASEQEEMEVTDAKHALAQLAAELLHYDDGDLDELYYAISDIIDSEGYSPQPDEYEMWIEEHVNEIEDLMM